MSTQTTHYNLVKPAASDYYDIAVANGNMDKIDQALHEKADSEQVIPASQKGVAGGVASLGSDGKVPKAQLPLLDYDPAGTADSAISVHNASWTAHSDIRQAISGHAGNTGNPHGVTAAQVGAYTREQVMSSAIPAMFGLGAGAVPSDVLAQLGKYNQHWWRRKANEIRYVMQVSGDSPVILCYADTPGSVQYSDSVDFNELTGEIALVSPVTASVEYAGESASEIKFLRGKYFKTSGKVYFASETASYYVDRYTPRSPYGIYAGEVTAIKQEVGEVSYVQSSSRSAYPDSGEQDGYKYKYLGIPFDNAVGAPKIETGSYVGTGTYGQSNPNRIVTGFPVKLLFIAKKDVGLAARDAYWSSSVIWVGGTDGAKIARSDNLCKFISNETGVSWYGALNGPEFQLNVSGATYFYLAFG